MATNEDSSAEGGLSRLEKAVINALSGDLPVCRSPFAEIAAGAGCSEREVLEMARRFEARGLIRRFGAILVHQRSGFSANAMVVWRVAAGAIAETGERFAGLPYVTHCYQRDEAPGWPYGLYTMIHAGSREALMGMVSEMARLSGAEDWAVLESLEELKKDSVRYFNGAAAGR